MERLAPVFSPVGRRAAIGPNSRSSPASAPAPSSHPLLISGPVYDKSLKQIWTQYQASEVITAQIIPGLFGGSALADTGPLAGLIAHYIDEKMLLDIAAEYSRGRILLVLTTNLDAQRPVVWNMGEIARAGDKKALELFRKVILASAAIPGAFPPVSIDVEANGKPYEEMHVDGGTMREVFVLPVQAPFRAFDPLYAAKPLRKPLHHQEREDHTRNKSCRTKDPANRNTRHCNADQKPELG